MLFSRVRAEGWKAPQKWGLESLGVNSVFRVTAEASVICQIMVLHALYKYRIRHPKQTLNPKPPYGQFSELLQYRGSIMALELRLFPVKTCPTRAIV